MKLSFADLRRSPAVRRRNTLLLLSGLCLVLAITTSLVVNRCSRLAALQETLETKTQAQAMQRNEVLTPARNDQQDLRDRARLRELQNIGARLNIDWSARLSAIEAVIPTGVQINSVKLDANKAEVELRGEANTTDQITRITRNFESNQFSARLVKTSRTAGPRGTITEFTVIASWLN